MFPKRISIFSDIGTKTVAGDGPQVLDGVDEAVYIRLFDPIGVDFDKRIDYFGSDLIVIIGEVFKAGEIAVLILRWKRLNTSLMLPLRWYHSWFRSS